MKKLQEKKMKVGNNIRCASFLIQLILLSLFLNYSLKAQVTDSLKVNKKKLTALTITTTATYGLGLIGLNNLWYKNTGRQSFRFFNDNAEWKQVDKLGHFYSAFYLSYGTSRALQWCNVVDKKSDLIGALTGFLVLAPIEIFDGFSDAYGASSGDLVANAAGTGLFLGQRYLWNEVRIYPKFSAHRTNHAKLRPELLGENTLSEILKNYNGQTYWLAADMDKFTRFPKWLNLAVGYGAHNMAYARDQENIAAGYNPFRQYYISVDLDLTAIRTRSKVLKTIFFIANAIKIPGPTLELSRKGLTYHVLYF
jgi:hypothetical protein